MGENLRRNNKLNVCIIIGQLGIGGTERQVCDLMKNFSCLDFEFFLICMSSKIMPRGYEIRKVNIPLYLIENKGKMLLSRLFILIKLLNSKKPDLIHSFGDAAGVFAAVASFFLKIPHIYSVRSFPQGKRLYVRFFRKLVFSQADAVTANSRALFDNLRRSRTLRKKSVFLTPNGVDPSRFTKKRNQLNIPFEAISNRKIVIYIGRDHPAKGMSFLKYVVKCLDSRLSEISHPVSIVMIGKGLEERMNSNQNELINLKLQFFEEVNKIESWLNLAHLLVLTSESESMPNVILEAMCCALPVVSTDSGGCSEAVVNEKSGYLVPRERPDLFISAVLELIQNEKLARQMGQEGRRIATQRFSWENACQKFLAVYEFVLKKRIEKNPSVNPGVPSF